MNRGSFLAAYAARDDVGASITSSASRRRRRRRNADCTLQGKRNQYRVKHRTYLEADAHVLASRRSARLCRATRHCRGVCPPSLSLSLSFSISLSLYLSFAVPLVLCLSSRPLVDRSRLDQRHLFSVTRRRVRRPSPRPYSFFLFDRLYFRRVRPNKPKDERRKEGGTKEDRGIDGWREGEARRAA